MRKFVYSFCIIFVTALITSCGAGKTENGTAAGADSLRIVSLNGTVSEILVGLGMEKNIVGVDVTSTYPESLKALAQVGHSHNLNTEAIIALKPAYVISLEERGIKPEQARLLEQAGIRVWVIKQHFSVEGTKDLIRMLAKEFKKDAEAEKLIATIDAEVKALPVYETKPKVLFVYARGMGSLQVAGDGTAMCEMIRLAGGIPATDGTVQGFRPLTAESVVSMDPDYILLFDTGLQSLEGPEGLMKVPGVAQTAAGKNNKFVSMDGQLLSGFGPRLGAALKQLGEAIHK
ncbi:MAG: heme/hemin ABC transporter substrate-binding protein [Flavobacteriales bacterium]